MLVCFLRKKLTPKAKRCYFLYLPLHDVVSFTKPPPTQSDFFLIALPEFNIAAVCLAFSNSKISE